MCGPLAPVYLVPALAIVLVIGLAAEVHLSASAPGDVASAVQAIRPA